MEKTNVTMDFCRVGMFQKCVHYAPAQQNDRSCIAVICIHSDGDYSDFPAGKALAGHGCHVLCGQVSRPEAALDEKLKDIKNAVDYARGIEGVEKVVLLGHSGGATLMSCYQSAAEKGYGIYRTEKMVTPIRDMGPLTPADGIMLIDSNWGNGVMTAVSIDPAVIDETSGVKLDKQFDVFAPENGFDENGSHYSEEFRKKFFKAQAQRNNRIIDACLERLDALEKHQGNYFDDEPFIVPGAAVMAPNNKMFPQDISLLCRTEGEYTLLHADGSATKEVIHSLRKPRGGRSTTPIYGMGAAKCSVRHYITSVSVRLDEDEYGYDATHITGVDWDSCFCCTPGNVRHIDCPTLVMGMTGGYECIAAETIYRNSPAADKEIAFVEGASHMLTPERSCEQVPGQFGDTVKTLFDYVDGWLSRHFA